MSIEIGAQMQSVRKHFGLSQRELAKRSGVTNATISLIEQNKVSSSVSSLNWPRPTRMGSDMIDTPVRVGQVSRGNLPKP